MNRVSLAALGNYQSTAIEDALQHLLEPLGGITHFVQPGQRLLIKPNLLAGKPPEKAVTTHPEIVRAVIRLAQQAGAEVSVGDSPGLGNPAQVAQKCGVMRVIEETGARFAPFTESVPIQLKNSTFHQLEIARDILEADVIFNLPKLKTHQMMGLTCGVKNLFGAVVGMRKARLHLQAGTDKGFFALMLLELAERINPALTIVDAVVGMEGDGPGSGDPVQIGALIAGANPLAVDAVACDLTRHRPEQVSTQDVAMKTSRPGSRLDEVELYGPSLDALRPAHFRPSKSTDVNFGLPGFIKRRLKRAITAYPVIEQAPCLRCGHCVSHCPPEAMTLKDRVKIDYDRCIRCFCCQELCPHNAIITEQGLLLKLATLLGKS